MPASLMGALSALLIRAARERPTGHVSARVVAPAFVGATLFGAVRGLEIGRNLTGLIIGAFFGALVGALLIVVDRSRPRMEDGLEAVHSKERKDANLRSLTTS